MTVIWVQVSLLSPWAWRGSCCSRSWVCILASLAGSLWILSSLPRPGAMTPSRPGCSASRVSGGSRCQSFRSWIGKSLPWGHVANPGASHSHSRFQQGSALSTRYAHGDFGSHCRPLACGSSIRMCVCLYPGGFSKDVIFCSDGEGFSMEGQAHDSSSSGLVTGGAGVPAP